MNKKFTCLCIDPPYSFFDKLQQSDVARGAAANYATMTNSEIKALPIKDLISPEGAILALWVPSSLLDFGLELMKEYGFNFKQTWVWVKIKNDPFLKLRKQKEIDWDKINWDDFLSFGMGRLGRNVHEVVLVGTCGKIYRKLKNKSQRTVFFATNTKHSKKPEQLQDKLDLMFPKEKKIELFARRIRPGWTCLGNSIDEKDIYDALAELM